MNQTIWSSFEQPQQLKEKITINKIIYNVSPKIKDLIKRLYNEWEQKITAERKIIILEIIELDNKQFPICSTISTQTQEQTQEQQKVIKDNRSLIEIIRNSTTQETLDKPKEITESNINRVLVDHIIQDETKTINKKNILCKFTLQGQPCKYGDNCNYYHSIQEIKNNIISDTSKYCKHGDKCSNKLLCSYYHDDGIFSHIFSSTFCPSCFSNGAFVCNFKQCPYIHKRSEKMFTQLCKKENCSNQWCSFAHSEDELCYTKMCNNVKNGKECSNDNCIYCHDITEFNQNKYQRYLNMIKNNAINEMYESINKIAISKNTQPIYTNDIYELRNHQAHGYNVAFTPQGIPMRHLILNYNLDISSFTNKLQYLKWCTSYEENKTKLKNKIAMIEQYISYIQQTFIDLTADKLSIARNNLFLVFEYLQTHHIDIINTLVENCPELDEKCLENKTNYKMINDRLTEDLQKFKRQYYGTFGQLQKNVWKKHHLVLINITENAFDLEKRIDKNNTLISERGTIDWILVSHEDYLKYLNKYEWDVSF